MIILSTDRGARVKVVTHAPVVQDMQMRRIRCYIVNHNNARSGKKDDLIPFHTLLIIPQTSHG